MRGLSHNSMLTISSMSLGILTYSCVLLGLPRAMSVGRELAPSRCVLLSTSGTVREDMKDWVLSQEGDRWSVKFDVRDLGGHLDATFRRWSATLTGRLVWFLLGWFLCSVIWLVLFSISRLLFLMLGGIRLPLIFAVESCSREG